MSDTIDYTDGEMAAMREALEQFDGYSAPAEQADRMRRAICSRALSQYAVATMTEASPSSDSPDASDMDRMQDALEEASASLQKAYQVYPFPFHLFDLAGLREVAGASDDARSLYERFLSELKAWRAEAIDGALLQERDVESDARRALARIAELRAEAGLAPQGRPWWKVW